MRGAGMTDVQWGKVRPAKRLSWHVFETWTRVSGRARSLCNRNLDGETVRDTRVAGEKTCEACYRKLDVR